MGDNRDTMAKVPSIDGYAKDVQKLSAGGQKVALPLVVYDLPDRDCAALTSNGEYAIADGGVAKYKAYIDTIAQKIKTYSDVRFILVVGMLSSAVVTVQDLTQYRTR